MEQNNGVEWKKRRAEEGDGSAVQRARVRAGGGGERSGEERGRRRREKRAAAESEEALQRGSELCRSSGVCAVGVCAEGVRDGELRLW